MKIIYILLFILLSAAIAAFIYFSGRKEKAIIDETQPFVEDTVVAISDGWNPAALVSRAEPGLINAMAAGGSVQELFNVYSTLGSLQKAPDCNVKDTSQFQGTADKYSTVSYTCDVSYQNGPATILITVRKPEDGSEWKVYYINISSPYFSSEGYRRTK